MRSISFWRKHFASVGGGGAAMTLPMDGEVGAQATNSSFAALAADLAREFTGDSSPLGRLDSAPRNASRVLRVEVNGSLHDWFDIEEMGDFVRSATFADTLLENIARYFGVPVESQAIYDEDGLLTTSADFSRALQRVSPMLYIYDVHDMGPELKERTVEELATINAGVEQSWKNFRMLGARGVQKGDTLDSVQREAENRDVDISSHRDDLDSASKPLSVANGAPTTNAAVVDPDDALLSAKSASPTSSGPVATAGSQIAPHRVQSGLIHVKIGSTAKFGTLDNEVAAADEAPGQVYSLLAPTTMPDSPSQAPLVLRLGAVNGGISPAGAPSAQTTARTAYSTAARNEELFAARSGTVRPGTGTSSPPGPRVRTVASPMLTPHTISVQQPVRASSDASSWMQGATRSPAQAARTRSTAAPPGASSVMLGTGQSMSWPPISSAAAPSVSPWSSLHQSSLLQPGSSDDLYMSRMVSSNQFLNMERPTTPKPATARSVTPPPQGKALSMEARSVTPPPQTIRSEARILNAGTPPVVSARSGLMRMASNSQLPYAPLRSLERSVSPIRAVRSVTPTTQQLGAESMANTFSHSQQRLLEDYHGQIVRQARISTTGPLRATTLSGGLSASVAPATASNRSLTPVRSVAHRSCLGGSHYASPTVSQAGPGQIAVGSLQHGLGSKDASNVSSYSSARF